MALNNYGTDAFVFSVDGREINDWGETETPYTDEPIDEKAILRRGQGGSAVKLNRINPGRRITINLNPGSPDSAFMQGRLTTGATVSCGYYQIGTLEAAIGTEGVVVNDAQVGRGGMSITDDVYVIECNIWSATKGGE